MCAGTYLTAYANVTDAAGVVYDIRLGLSYGTPDVVATSVHTNIALLGELPHSLAQVPQIAHAVTVVFGPCDSRRRWS